MYDMLESMEDNRPRILLATSLEQHFARGILHGVVAYARQCTRWRLVPTPVCDVRADKQRRMCNAGLISLSPDTSVAKYARSARLPMVLVGGATRDFPSQVCVDEAGVGRMAADYLAGLGLRHFACVGHGEWAWVHERLGCFTAAVEALGHGPVHQLIGVIYDRRRKTRFDRELATMLRSLPRPCGVLAANDLLGAAVIETCRAIGLRVPDDIAVVGVDDDQLVCELCPVPLSSVVQPLFTIGYEAARLLHQHMDDPKMPPKRVLLPPQGLVPRLSSDLLAMDDEHVVAALKLIKEHACKPINVDWIVRQLPITRRSLERKFKATLGRTVLDHIHHVRVQRAKMLLSESDMSMQAVAERSGFANARWLADSFRREEGITPSDFRRQFRSHT